MKRNAIYVAMVSTLCVGVMSASAQDLANLDKINKELDIMSNIIKASYSSEDKKSRIRSINARYLAKQGALFTIDTGRNGFSLVMPHVMEFSGLPEVPEVPEVPEAPEAPSVVSETAYAFTIGDGDDEISWSSEGDLDNVHVFVERAREQQEQLRDQLEEQREVRERIREKESEIRELAMQMRFSDEKDKAKIAKQQKDLEKTVAELEAEAGKMKEKTRVIRVEMDKKRKQSAEEEAKRKQALAATLEQSVSQSLCTYGQGLTSLSENEFVNVVLKGLAESTRPGDLYLTYSVKDIQACNKGKLNAKQLAEKSIRYRF